MSKGPENLYIVRWKDRAAKSHISLVAANTHSFALGVVERLAPGEIVQRPSVEELYIYETDSYDYAEVIWEGGNVPGVEA